MRPFLGRGRRGGSRSQGSNPWRGRPPKTFQQSRHQGWWNPPQWVRPHSPLETTGRKGGEVVEVDEESSKKRRR